MTRDEMLEKLKAGECAVTFVKADNSTRVMKCTLNLDEVDVPQTYSSNPNSDPERITVWDLEKQAWRQFKVSTVLDFS